MLTNLCANSHGNSANTSPIANDHRYQTPKDTAVHHINHIFTATE